MFRESNLTDDSTWVNLKFQAERHNSVIAVECTLDAKIDFLGHAMNFSEFFIKKIEDSYLEGDFVTLFDFIRENLVGFPWEFEQLLYDYRLSRTGKISVGLHHDFCLQESIRVPGEWVDCFCLRQPADIVFGPCRHFCVCRCCVSNVAVPMNCVICKEKVSWLRLVEFTGAEDTTRKIMNLILDEDNERLKIQREAIHAKTFKIAFCFRLNPR